MIRIGIDIGGTKIHIIAFDKTGTIHQQQKLASHSTLHEAPTPGQAIAHRIDSFLIEGGIPRRGVEGIVIGFPGVRDMDSDSIITCPNLPVLDNQPVGRQIEQILNIPTYIENDVNLIALGEHSVGRGQGIRDLACIFVGSGLGCALILNNILYQGADGMSGELGHVPIEPHGLLCTCGGIGCLEMYCSGKALTVRAQNILGKQYVEQDYHDQPWALAESIIQAARDGHQAAVGALNEAFFYLGLGIVFLTNTLNLRLVIVGGGIVNGWPQGLETVKQVVRERGRIGIRDKVLIDYPKLTDLPHLHGANAFLEKQLQG